MLPAIRARSSQEEHEGILGPGESELKDGGGREREDSMGAFWDQLCERGVAKEEREREKEREGD